MITLLYVMNATICAKPIVVFTDRLCIRHDQTLVIVDTSGQHIFTLPELEMGIEMTQLKEQNECRISEPTKLAS